MHRTFSEKPYAERFELMGDMAEQRFQEWATENNVPYSVYGLRRPAIPVWQLPAFVRYTPDFVVGEGLMEVQGCGRDQHIKLKHDKLWALSEWDEKTPVWLWLWNQTWDQVAIINMDGINYLCRELHSWDYRTDGYFDGDKPYTSIRWDVLMDHRGVLRTPDDWLMFRADWRTHKAGVQ